MKVDYRPYNDGCKDELCFMIKSLYIEDPEGNKMTEEKIEKTIKYLKEHDDNGEILIFFNNQTIIGYSILINYWSNEFGGIILFIDELYVKEDYRGKGAGTNFINHLINEKYNHCKAICLEVLPSNTRAQKLYSKIGFLPLKNNVLRYEIID